MLFDVRTDQNIFLIIDVGCAGIVIETASIQFFAAAAQCTLTDNQQRGEDTQWFTVVEGIAGRRFIVRRCQLRLGAHSQSAKAIAFTHCSGHREGRTETRYWLNGVFIVSHQRLENQIGQQSGR